MRGAADRAAGRTTSDFRIYFNGPLGADGVTDQAYVDGVLPPATEAQLVIGYNGP